MNARVALLEAAFREIADTRMVGIPVLNPRLEVEAVGFGEQLPGPLLGVLITPWFMNLVRLPRVPAQAPGSLGRSVSHELGEHRVEFTTAHQDTLGAFEVCSLFSPVLQFADQEAARATAREVLRELGLAEEPVARPGAVSRRGFLFARTRDGAAR